MKTFCAAFLMCVLIPAPLRAQLRAPSLPTPGAAVPAQNLQADIAARSRELNALFNDVWQDKLRHDPEYATFLGDKRYDTELDDHSPSAVNEALARGRAFIARLSAIDTTGLPHQEQLSAELMLRSLIEDQEGAQFKEWEMPVNQYDGIQLDLAQLAEHTQFDSVDDYDHYVSRLGKVPLAFSQTMTNMQTGVDDHRTPPAYLMEKALAQTQAIAAQKPADSPFAEPLKNFPASVSAADRKRITEDVLNAISTQVLPSYQRFAKFLSVAYIPNCRKDPGIWAIPDGDAYYAFRIRQSTTLDKSAAEIHQIGLDEVKRDEAEMLAIVHKLGYADLKSFAAALKANPKEHPASPDALLAAYRGTSRRCSRACPNCSARSRRRSWRSWPCPPTWRPISPRPSTIRARPTASAPATST